MVVIVANLIHLHVFLRIYGAFVMFCFLFLLLSLFLFLGFWRTVSGSFFGDMFLFVLFWSKHWYRWKGIMVDTQLLWFVDTLMHPFRFHSNGLYWRTVSCVSVSLKPLSSSVLIECVSVFSLLCPFYGLLVSKYFFLFFPLLHGWSIADT